MEEKIVLSQVRSATTAVYFSNGFIPTNGQIQLIDSFAELDAIGRPISITNYDGKELWKRNSDNIFENLQASNRIVTGYSFVEKFNYLLEESDKNFYSARFIDRYNSLSQQTLNSLSANTAFNNPSQISFVFFENAAVDDYYANVYIHRTTKTLDTFNVYNNLLESTPNQQSNYGVVFGKLEAIQTIKDINGNNIRIPLRNVPIGIFNESNEFPTPTSQDDNGDRIYLNLKESSRRDEYFNTQSYNSDNNFYLRSGSAFSEVPAQYKYITTTNDNGEFVIYDSPIGTQTLIFEVDLLKQGLTPDEVALNFFPYPGSFDANVDQIPHFFFRQIPISVVPAWGDFQTGYTEVNIQANLDLKKWATFFIPPMATQRDSTGTDAVTVDDLLGSGTFRFYNVDIRDMSRDGFPKNTISVVEIENMFNRKDDQAIEWESEFVQRKDKAVFRTNDFHAFKVPANMYDPNEFKRNGDGSATNLKGVWLAGYQYKMYFVDRNVFRATGFHRLSTGSTRNNYDLNKNIQDPNLSCADTESLGVGAFPYDRKWDHTYPEKYSIPSIPTIINTSKTYFQQGNPSVGQPIDISEPKYLDGDLIGDEVDGLAGGYGIMNYQPSGQFISTRFSQRVTKNLIYKYESGVTLDDKYTNGYTQGTTSNAGAISIVAGGERWQRVECGHGYFMLPEGWPRVQNNQWGDSIVASDSNPSNPNIVNFEFKDLALIMDLTSPVKEGYLNIYRIINTSPQNLLNPDAPFIPTYTRFIIERVYRLQDKTANLKFHSSYNNSADRRSTSDDRLLIYGTSDNNRDKAFFGFKIKITNFGVKTVKNPINPSQEIGIGDFIILDSDEILDYQFEIENILQGTAAYSNNNPKNAFSITLEGNSGFDSTAGKYTSSNYSFEIIYDSLSVPQNSEANRMNTPPFIFNSANSAASELTTNVFLKTFYRDVQINATAAQLPNTYTQDASRFIQADKIAFRGLVLGIVQGNTSSVYEGFSWVSTSTLTSPINQDIPSQNTLGVVGPGRNKGQVDTYMRDEFSTGWQVL